MSGSGPVPARADARVEEDLCAVERDEERLRAVEADLARDTARGEHDLHPEHPTPAPRNEHQVTMNYHPLTLVGNPLTGAEIKEQAIAAGIPRIKKDFHLTVERSGDETEHTVGDDEKWHVRDGDCFTAVKPDDNS